MRISDWSSDVCSSDLAEIVGPVDGRNQDALHACRDEFCIGHDPRNTTVAICEWMHLRYEKHHVHGTGECRLQAAVEIESLPPGPFDVAGIDNDRLPGTVDLLLDRKSTRLNSSH